MKKLKLCLLASAFVGGVNFAFADDVFKNVTSDYLTNADFEGEYSVYSSPSSDRAIYQPSGWTVNYTGGAATDITSLSSSTLQWSTFSGKTQPSSGGNNVYWTCFDTKKSGQQLELSQTITLPFGTYILSADYYKNGSGGDGYIFVNSTTKNTSKNEDVWNNLTIEFTSNGSSTTKIGHRTTHTNTYTKYLAYDNFVLRWNLTKSLTDLLAEANTFYSAEGDSYTALKAVIDATNVEETDADELESQYNALSAALDLAKNHRKLWLTAKTAAQTAIANTEDYGNVTGVEKSELQAAIAAAEPSDADDYDTAKSNLETKTNAFTVAKTNYDALVSEIAKAKALGIADATADGYAATSSSTSESVLASTQALKVTEFNYVSDNYTESLMLDSWTESTVKTESTNPWDGSSSYKASNGYDSNSWNSSFSKSLELPAGDYVFKVAGRRSSNSAMWIEVKNGETTLGTVNDFPKASTGLGINTSGATDFTTGDGHTYANSGNGYGWEWRYVKFTLAEKATVTVAVKGSAGVKSQWINFANYTVLTNSSLNVSLYKYYTALSSATSARDNATYTNVDGKEKADIFAAIAADESLDKTSKTDVDAATTALTAATTAFTNADAVTNYNALNTAITDAQAIVEAAVNVGDGAFQIPTAAKTTLSGAVTTASGIKSNATKTKDDASTAATTLNAAVTAYQGAQLNAPAVGVQYRLKATATSGKSWKDKIYTMAYDAGKSSQGYHSISANQDAASYLAQAWAFTVVNASENTYTISMTDEAGDTRYVCTNKKGYGGSGTTTQIRTTTEQDKALVIKVIANTGTDGRWFLQNTEDDSYIGGQDAGFYSNSQNYDLAIETASQASVDVTIASAVKYATRIFPFAPTLPDGVEAYTATVSGDKVTLAKVDAPAANVPYILYAASGYSGDALTGWGTAAATSYTNEVLTGVYEATEAPNDSYVLLNKEGVVAFHQVDNTSKPTVGANRAYLTAPTAARALYFDAEAAGIKAIDALTSGDAEFFDANGVRLPALHKGLNIVKTKGGKTYKVVVK